MSLLFRDYVLSVHSFDETWQLVARAIQASSSEQFSWRLEEDRQGHRITATMEYQRPLRLKRTLLIEVNFLAPVDEKIRLELNYDIRPMLYFGEAEEILLRAKNAIAMAVTSDGRVFSSQHAVPAELSDMEATAKGEKGIMRGIEIVLIFSIIALIAQPFVGQLFRGSFAFDNPVEAYSALVIPLGLFILAGLGAIVFLVIRGAKARQEGRQRSIAENMATGVLAVLCGVAICVVALPIILLGLCVGTFTLMSVTRH